MESREPIIVPSYTVQVLDINGVPVVTVPNVPPWIVADHIGDLLERLGLKPVDRINEP